MCILSLQSPKNNDFEDIFMFNTEIENVLKRQLQSQTLNYCPINRPPQNGDLYKQLFLYMYFLTDKQVNQSNSVL